MPVNSALAFTTWQRYAYCRDAGHTKFMEKADKCERFFAGDQWEPADLAALALARRPALTINKIISTISNVMGEQIFNRAETSFRPRGGSPSEVAEILSKVFKQISDNTQLDWKRSDMFADGIIGSRGFLDLRIDYGSNAQGEVCLSNINSRNVIVDPDADKYDPDEWNEVFTTKWLTADDIAVLYSKEDAELLRNKDSSAFPYGYDSIQLNRARFGSEQYPAYEGGTDFSSVTRSVRVVERQHRKLDMQRHFLDPQTGDMRPIPEEFTRERIAMFVQRFGLRVIKKPTTRIRWTVIADNVVLHDDWSPYKHFTIIPFFPYFRYGKTIGLVENLLGPQELLNKVSSQELHVVNTTANSGYKVKAGSLVNMTTAELEQKGGQSGIVLEINGDPERDVVKIAPNQVPQGLDRISYKAEEHIKTISGVSDSMQGMDRADVAAKAIQAKRQAGSTGMAKPLDSLTRTDYILARNTLDLIQEFYTEPRLMTITHDEATGENESFQVNQPNPMSAEEHAESDQAENPYSEILNDLTLGEYDVVVSSVPRRETLEDSQFEQASSLKEMGVAIPDSVLIEASRLNDKKAIIKKMEGDKTSPEATAQAQLQQRGQEANVSKLEGEAAQKHADAGLKQAKTQETQVKAQVLANTPIEAPGGGGNPELEHAQAVHEADMAERKQSHQENMDMLTHNQKQRTADAALQLKAQDMAQKRQDAQDAQVQQAAAQAAKPQPQPTAK